MLGLGTGLFVAPNLRAVMSSVPPERHGVGSALFTLFLNIGLTVSLNFAVLSYVLYCTLQSNNANNNRCKSAIYTGWRNSSLFSKSKKHLFRIRDR